MSKFQELLASKKNTVPKPQPAIPTKEHAASNQATGMASSATGTSFLPSAPPKEIPKDAEYDPVKAANALAVYKDNGRFSKYIRPKGGKVYAVDGFYYPTTQEDVDLLEGVVKRGSVKRITITKDEE